MEFPQQYEIPRDGSLVTVVVEDFDGLVALRTELALLRAFGRGATDELLTVMRLRVAQLEADSSTDEQREKAQDFLNILQDAMHPATEAAIAEIDEAYPQISGEMNMDSVERENQQFHEDVAEELADSGIDDADAIAKAFAEAETHIDADAPEEAVTAPMTDAQEEDDPIAAAINDAAADQTLTDETADTDDTSTAPAAEEPDAAQTEDEPDPIEAALAQAAVLEDDAGEPAVIDPVAEAMAEAAQSSGESETATDDTEPAEADDPLADILAETEQPESDPVAEILAEQAQAQGEQAQAQSEQADTSEPQPEASSGDESELADELLAGQTDPIQTDSLMIDGVEDPQELAQTAAEIAEAAEFENAMADAEDVLSGLGTEESSEAESTEPTQEQPGESEATADFSDITEGAASEAVETPTEASIDESATAEGDTAAVAASDVASENDAGSGSFSADEAVESLDSLTSAFEEAAEDLGDLSQQVAAEMAVPTAEEASFDDLSDDANPAGLADIEASDEEETTGQIADSLDDASDWLTEDASVPQTDDVTPAGQEVISTQTSTEPVHPQPTASSGSQSQSQSLRTRLETIKQNLQNGLEQIGTLLDDIDQTHQSAQQKLEQAQEFQQAARKASEASKQFVQAQEQANEARAAFELAQQQLESARQEYESAQQQADSAAVQF